MDTKQKKNKPLIGVSGCLLGEEVRYDGQHKKHPHILHEMAEEFEYISFCPEVSMGLGIPRPTIHLTQADDKLLLVNSKDSSIDHTDLAKKTCSEFVFCGLGAKQEVSRHVEVCRGRISTHRI